MIKRTSTVLSAGRQGEDKRNLPERIPLDKCESIENYKIAEDQRFIVRGGKQTLLTITGATEIFDLEYINKDLVIVSWMDDTDSFIGKIDIPTLTLTTLHTYTGVKHPIKLKGYGDWAYACNGIEQTSSKIVALYTIGAFLNYDAQTTDFGVGQTVSAGTTAGSANIVAIVDNGATGILVLSNITGTFADNATLTSSTGSATINGTLYYSYQFTDARCPKAETLDIIQNNGLAHLIAGCTSSSTSTSEWSNGDDNTGIPFSNWTVANELQPNPNEGTFTTFGNGGILKDICFSKGKVFQIYENGIFIFHIENNALLLTDSSTGMVQVVKNEYSFDGRGGYKIVATDYGVFYTGKDGVYMITSEFLNGQNISESLKTEEGIFDIDFSNGDLAWDGGKRLYASGAQNSEENNVVLVYDMVFGAWSRWTLALNKIVNVQGKLYGIEASTANFVQLESGYDDDGMPIECKVRFRADNGGSETIFKKTRRFYVKGLIPSGETMKCAVHTWDKRENGIFEKKVYYMKGNTVTNPLLMGYGQESYGGAGIYTEPEIDSYNIADKKMKITKMLKYQVELSISSNSYHEIHFAEIEFDIKKKLKNNNFSTTP